MSQFTISQYENAIIKTENQIFQDFKNVIFDGFEYSLMGGEPVFLYNGNKYGVKGNMMPVLSPRILTFCAERLSANAKKKLKTNIPQFKQLCQKICDAGFFDKKDWDTEIAKAVQLISGKSQTIRVQDQPEQ